MSFDFFSFSFRDTGILSTRKFRLVNANNQKGLLSNRASSIFNVLEIVPKQQELICSDLYFFTSLLAVPLNWKVELQRWLCNH